MTTLREAAEMALEALESLEVRCTDSETVTAWYPEATNKLREALSQPEPEPVAWTTMYWPDADDWLFLSGRANPNGKLKGEWTALYTHPPQRKPLTDEEIIMLSKSAGVYLKVNDDCDLLFARAIEKAHGIGDEK